MVRTFAPARVTCREDASSMVTCSSAADSVPQDCTGTREIRVTSARMPDNILFFKVIFFIIGPPFF